MVLVMQFGAKSSVDIMFIPNVSQSGTARRSIIDQSVDTAARLGYSREKTTISQL